ncbi:MAG: aminoglycoside phosphotransferase family protein [Lachnospiraceae bacterium]
MKLEEKNIISERSYKKVYQSEDKIIKVFEKTHPKADVFNEALNQARIEETGLEIPKILEVTQVEDKWALVLECKHGQTLENLMNERTQQVGEYMEQFVELQLLIHEKKAPLLTKLKDKLVRQINSLKEVDATTRYELLTRLDGMPKHTKVCHGDFNPSNVIVDEDGNMTILDWSHATQGNASADAAMTYLLFALKDETLAAQYMELFCKKSDTPKQYVQQWLPIVAAAQLTKDNELEKEFLMKWIDVVDYQ